MSMIQFIHIVDFMILMPLGPQLMRLFGITTTQFGLLVSIYTISAGVSGFLASFFIDRFDRKRSLLLFFFGFIVGTFFCALAPSYGYLLLARALTGFFGGILGSLVMAIVADNFAYERRGSAMGIVMGSFSLSSIFGVPFGLYLANLYSWHAPFIFLGVTSSLICAIGLWMIPPLKGHLHPDRPKSNPSDVIRRIIENPNQQRALFFMFCLVMGQFSIIPFLSPSFVANAGLKESELPLIYLFGGLCSMVAAPSIGRLADKYGKHKIFTIGVLVSIVPILVITNLPPTPLWLLLLISCFFFICMSSRMVPAMTIVSATARAENRGSFLSISSCVQQLSAGFASWLGGAIIINDSQNHILRYNWVGYIAAAASILALFAAHRVKNEENK